MPTLTPSSICASTSNCGAVATIGGWIAILTSAVWIPRGSESPNPLRRRCGEQAGHAFLQAYIAHLQDTGLDNHVIAYQIGAGRTGEWVKGHTSMWHTCGDYSLPMQRCFRDWLSRTYHEGDVTNCYAGSVE